MTKAMPEYRLQEHVTAALKQLNWLCYHTFMSMRSEPGFPDVVAAKDGRIIIAELKRDGRMPTKAQERWLDAFRLSPCVEVYVWTGSDWESGEIVRVLSGQEAS